MAAPWRNVIIGTIDKKILGLQERAVTTGVNVQKLMEDSGLEGTADDMREVAENENKKFEEFSEKLKKFKEDLGNQRSRPSQLGPYVKSFQELRKEFDAIDQSVSENLLVLEIIQEPTVEEQEQSPDLLQSKELQGSGNAASQTTVGNLEAKILLQDMRGMENFDGKKIQNETPSSSYGRSPLTLKNPTPKLSPVAAVAGRNEGEKEIEVLNQFPTGTNRNFCDIMMDLYGFERIQCERIDREVRKALTKNPSQGTGSLTEGRILNWKGVSEVMKDLESFKKQRAQNVIPEFLLKVWIFRMENQMYWLVLYLLSIMAGFDPAMESFRKLRNSLEEHRQSKNGMVPILVHRILALLELQGVVEQSDFNRDQQEALYGKLGFNEVIDSIHRMILQMTSLLNPNDAIPNVLETYERVLREVGREMCGIERRIIDGRKNVQEKRKMDDEDSVVVEGRKNIQEKRKREDEDGGNGGRSLEM